MKKLLFMLVLLIICGSAFAEIKVKEYFRPDCPHCKNMVSVVERFEKEFPSVEFEKVNITQNQAMAQKDGVRSVPTFIVYENGKEIGGFSGERKYDDFTRSIIDPPKRPRPPIDLLPLLAWSQIGMQLLSTICLLFIALKVGAK